MLSHVLVALVDGMCENFLFLKRFVIIEEEQMRADMRKRINHAIIFDS